MEETLEKKLQESEAEWAKLERLIAEREKKDKRIISEYCANNNSADIYNILELLEKYDGMPEYDKETVSEFKDNYPIKLTVNLIHRYEDLKDIYNEYLESGGADI